MRKSAMKNGSCRGNEADFVDQPVLGSSPGIEVSASSPRRLRPPDSLQPAIRMVMMPRDANYLGTIFGGVILSSLDLAGAVEAARHTVRKLVTAAMREVKFIAPVFVGDLVSFYADTLKVGKTSITVRVTVEAQRAEAPHEIVRVTQAEVVYVAIDETGNPVSVRS